MSNQVEGVEVVPYERNGRLNVSLREKRKPSPLQECVGDAMRGKHYGNREAVQAAFKEAREACRARISKDGGVYHGTANAGSHQSVEG